MTTLNHGHARRGKWSDTYKSWAWLKKRSNHHPAYTHVTVDPTWLGEDGFTCFLQDMGPRPAGMTVERKDNALGYTKNNCIWATMTVQAQNRSTTQHLTIDGVTKNISDWCLHYGISRGAYEGRRRRNGMSELQALTTPLKK